MPDRRSPSWHRKFNRYVGIVATSIGVATVLSSFFFVQDMFLWYVTVIGGLVIAIAGFLYGVFPVLTSGRRYLALRREVEEFVALVRELNDLAITSGKDSQFDAVKTAMHESVERMADLVGREGKA